MREAPPPLGAFAMVEGLHLAHAAAALEALGLFDLLAEPWSADALARRHGLDAEILGGLLDYLARRTDLVVRTGDLYSAGAGCDVSARFLLNLYAGAFGPAVAALAATLKRPSGARSRVDRKAQARAFETAGGGAAPPVAAVIAQLGLDRLLDVGCGSATVLTALAVRDRSFRGWGLDANPAMVRAARKRLSEAKLGRRLRILEGDCFDVARSVPRDILGKVRTVLASQVANELFRGGGTAFVRWLERLRGTLPDRILVIADYYGRLYPRSGEADQFTLLHDFCQLISGQGVPPPDAAGWTSLYEAAGCELKAVIDDPSATCFIHLLRL